MYRCIISILGKKSVSQTKKPVGFLVSGVFIAFPLKEQYQMASNEDIEESVRIKLYYDLHASKLINICTGTTVHRIGKEGAQR